MQNARDSENSLAGGPEQATVPGMSRRACVGGLLAVGVGAVFLKPLRASAVQKAKQEDAKYQGSPKGSQKCSGCSQFEAPDACKVVDGKISPEGWCQLFTAKA